MINFDDESLEKMILDGIVEFAGLDKNGEMLYSFTENLERDHPFINKIMQEMHMQDIYYLWQHGFLNMDATEKNPVVTITERALNEREVDSLPDHLRILLEQIKEKMLENPEG